MRFQEIEYLLQLVCGKSIIVRKLNRTKPEFGFLPALFDMDMRRLVSFVRIEVKPKAVESKHRGHLTRSFALALPPRNRNNSLLRGPPRR